MSNEPNRGEEQQLQFLERAQDQIESAIKCHNAGMIDPAFSRAQNAQAFLEEYCEGPVLAREPDDGE